MTRKKISIDIEDLGHWEAIAAKLHYGPKSKYKLLRRLLAYALIHPIDFLNRR
jgi:hypothetical protein